MTLSDSHKAIMAAVGLLALGATSVGVFQTQAAAKEQAKQIEAKADKSVNELRTELYLARVKAINDKAEPTKDELDEKARLLALVQAIEAEAKVKR